MAITFPYDILTDFPGWSTEFDLLWRQEQSRSAGGKTYVKDLGTPLWEAKYQSISLSPNELDYWRARFKLLDETPTLIKTQQRAIGTRDQPKTASLSRN